MALALFKELITENHTGYKVMSVITTMKNPKTILNAFVFLLLMFIFQASFHQNNPYPSDSLLTIAFASNKSASEKKDFVILTAAAIPN